MRALGAESKGLPQTEVEDPRFDVPFDKLLVDDVLELAASKWVVVKKNASLFGSLL